MGGAVARVDPRDYSNMAAPEWSEKILGNTEDSLQLDSSTRHTSAAVCAQVGRHGSQSAQSR